MKLAQASAFTITVANAITTVTANSDFKTLIEAVGTNEMQFAPVSKEIEFKQPEVSTDEVKLIGSTSGIQNSELDPQGASKGEFTGTLIVSPDKANAFDFEQFMLTASATPPTGYTRYNYASASPVLGVAVLIQFNGGTGGAIINWCMNNATIETLGGLKLSADGHGEQDIRVTAAAKDCYKEFDADGGTS